MLNHTSMWPGKEVKHMKKEFPKPPPQEWYDEIVLPSSWELIRGRLNGKKVLDIGCASGWVSYWARKEGADVLATDIFDTMVRPDLPFQKCDKENLPFRARRFDFVLTANVLHHGNLKKTAREAHRVLKDTGELVSLQEPCIPNDVDEEEFLREHCQHELELGIDERRPSLERYQEALKMFSEVSFYGISEDIFRGKRRGLTPILKGSHNGGIVIWAKK